MKVRNISNNFIITLGLFLLATSCSWENTTVEFGSFFEPTWDFSESSKLSFDGNYVEVKNGKAQLKPLDLEHIGNDFLLGNGVGFELVNNQLTVKQSIDQGTSQINSILPSRSSDLVGYWRIDSADPLKDDSSFGHSGINTNVVVSSPGKVTGNNADFDGSSTKLEINDHDALSLNEVGDKGSLSLWVNPSSSGVQHVVSKLNEWALTLRPAVAGYVYPRLDLWGDSSGVAPSLAINNWYHIVVTWEAGVGGVIYINGDEIHSYSSVDTSVNSANPLCIGAYLSNCGSEHFSGNLDEIILFNDELSAGEVSKIYREQVINFTELSSEWAPRWADLEGYWKMDGTWQDSSDNDNHGTGLDGAAFTDDAVVGARSGVFDDLGDGVNIGSLSGFQSTSFSVGGWFSVTQLASNRAVSNVVWSNYTDVNNRIYLFQANGDDRLKLYGVSGGVPVTNADSGVVLVPNKWHHVFVTCSVAQNESQLYIDGVMTGAAGTCGNVNIDNHFLGIVDGTAQSLTGGLDDIGIWSGTLSHSEIRSIYERQKQKYASHYDSEVIDFGSATSSWPLLSWSTDLPFGKELVGDYDKNGSPDKESAIDYPDVARFDQDLVGLWQFNESVANTGPSSSDFFDSSGHDHYGDLLGTLALNQTGKFSSAIYFSGVEGESVEVPYDVDFDSPIGTFSLWIYTDLTWGTDGGSGAGGQGSAALISHGEPDSHPGLVLSLSGDFVQLQGSDAACGSPCNEVQFTSTNKVIPNTWNHIAITYNMANGSTQNIFLNGVKTSYTATGAWSMASDEKLIFGDFEPGTAWYEEFEGKIDELAFWKRALSDAEIQQLYQRGINRVKLQVKSCIDSGCECKSFSVSPTGTSTDCDGDTTLNALDFDDIHKADFVGPGGDGTTYYSELFNRKSADLNFNCGTNSSDSNSNICVNDEITLSAGAKPTEPNMDYNYFPLAARPNANPYFQYRVYLEADENTTCSGSPCAPEVTSVSLNTLGVDRYYGDVQELSPQEPLPYKNLQSISIDADDCVTFQLSHNGSDYFYYNSGSWVTAADNTFRSTKTELENNITKFGEQYGPGLLYIKTFLISNSSQTASCAIRSIDVASSNK